MKPFLESMMILRVPLTLEVVSTKGFESTRVSVKEKKVSVTHSANYQ